MVTLSPLVFWSQSKKNLLIKIDLKDVKGPTIKLEKRTLEFEAKGVGAQGPQNYGFSLAFYSEINTEESSCKIQDGKVRFYIGKAKKCWWPRLTAKSQKFTWLKKDNEQWTSDDEINKDGQIRELTDYFEKGNVSYTKENLKKTYLVIYNLSMFISYTYVLTTLVILFLQNGSDCFSGIYQAFGTIIRYLHILQLSEVILATIGVTSKDVSTVVMHLVARLLFIIFIIDSEPMLQTEPVIFYLYLNWSAVEIIRHAFDITQIFKVDIAAVTWLTNTLWMFSLPFGLTTEAVIIYKSIFYLEDTNDFTYSNVSFFIPILFRILLLVGFIPVTYIMMSQMYQARTKNLGSKGPKSQNPLRK